jgi:hypothetical protein
MAAATIKGNSSRGLKLHHQLLAASGNRQPAYGR